MNPDPINAAALVVALVTLLVGIVIASKQGAFKRPKLQAYFGNGGPANWLVVFGIPDSPAPNFLLPLPLVLENNGNTALKDLLLRVACDARRDYRPFFDTASLDYSVLPTKTEFSDTIQYLTYEIPILRPGEKLPLPVPLAVSKPDFKPLEPPSGQAQNAHGKASLKGSVIADVLKFQIIVDNHRSLAFRLRFLAIMPTATVDELEKTTNILLPILLTEEARQRVSGLILLKLLIRFRPRIVVTTLYYQLSLTAPRLINTALVAFGRRDNLRPSTTDAEIDYKKLLSIRKK